MQMCVRVEISCFGVAVIFIFHYFIYFALIWSAIVVNGKHATDVCFGFFCNLSVLCTRTLCV